MCQYPIITYEYPNWTVYMHINKTNKKKYIGITGQSLAVRFGKDGKGYQSCTVFYRAIQSYGWDGFDHVVLLTGCTSTLAGIME